MTRFSYEQSYIYFNVGVLDTNLKELAKAGGVHYCTLFFTEELFIERHDKTRYSATIVLEDNTQIVLHEYSLKELDEKLQKTITPIWEMKDVYDRWISGKLTPHPMKLNNP